jgi:nucleotide-binding universal stress UspA family protein
MQYRTVLLNLNDEPRVPNLVNAAASLMDGNGHIVGLYAVPSALPPPNLAGVADMPWLKKQLRAFEDQAERIRQNFEVLMKDKSLTYEWCFDSSSFDKSVADSVIDHGRTADLIVVSRASQNGWLDDVAERVAIEGGRPVVVLPDDGDLPSIAEITLAWKRSKEATRAVFDALPLLKRAHRVRVLTVVEEGVMIADRDRSSAAELAAALSRHGINVETESLLKGALSVGDCLLDYAKSRNQDLLVMGLYGRSRFREFFLGGASRAVLNNTSVPVLLSH